MLHRLTLVFLLLLSACTTAPHRYPPVPAADPDVPQGLRAYYGNVGQMLREELVEVPAQNPEAQIGVQP